MKPLLLMLAAAGAALTLSACAGGPGYYRGGGAGVGDLAYYDDFYGPYFDGYWGDDGGYWFRASDHDAWRRDDGHHFQHMAANGFHDVHPRGGRYTGAPHHPGV